MSVEAPERIWAASVTDNYGEWQTVKDGLPRPVEYVRADKLEEIAAENERLKEYSEVVTSKYKRLVHETGPAIIERAEKAEAALAEAKRENEALRELVDSAESIFINCSVTDGMCCCGDNMENHPSPMSCGHTPVDHGSYQVDLWIKARNAGGNDA